jgi:predicted dehydrogenase
MFRRFDAQVHCTLRRFASARTRFQGSLSEEFSVSRSQSRRGFLKSAGALAAAASPAWYTGVSQRAFSWDSPNERPIIGCIGTGDRWNAVGMNALQFGDCVAVCDVDLANVEKGKAKVTEKQTAKGREASIEMYEDYRKILERKDIDVVTIVTPDHWHSKIAIEAMQAGKDVYCEKPLTLTIEEGKQIVKVLKETNRVFQVGTQQRSEMGHRFLQAIAMIRDGRIGEIKKVTCGINRSPTSGELPVVEVPKGLNWDMWLGQAPMVEYVSGPKPEKGYAPSRCHYEFRWWYEYSGGKLTDWGAHHVDIAQWAIGMDKSGPISIEGTAEHPCTMKDGHPVETNKYNVATKFDIKCLFANGVEMTIDSESDNGILFEGTEGRLFVNRGKIEGKPVELLKEKPLPEDWIKGVYKGKDPRTYGGNEHMANFFDCVKTREEPISDVYTHHRAMSTCHLANIAVRLGRKINWNPETEEIVGDADAKQWQGREQRKGYEITT